MFSRLVLFLIPHGTPLLSIHRSEPTFIRKAPHPTPAPERCRSPCAMKRMYSIYDLKRLFIAKAPSSIHGSTAAHRARIALAYP